MAERFLKNTPWRLDENDPHAPDKPPSPPVLYDQTQRFSAAVDAAGRTTDLRVGPVVDEIVKILSSAGERIVRGKLSRGRLRIYSGPGRNMRGPLGRFTVAHELRTRFLRENPMTFAPDSRAASDSRWLGILDAVINCQAVAPDETEAAGWALDHLEIDPTPGSYLKRSEVLDGFLKAHPGPAAVRARELMQALRDVAMMQPGPSGRVISDPALWIGGEKVRVLFGLRWLPENPKPLITLSDAEQLAQIPASEFFKKPSQ